MFLSRVDNLFGSQLLQGAYNAEAGVSGLDNIVDVSVTGCIVRVAEQFVVFGFFFFQNRCGSADSFASRAYSTSTAPAPPITAISAVGHA